MNFSSVAKKPAREAVGLMEKQSYIFSHFRK